MKAESGVFSNADPVARNGAENNGARRSAQPVDNHRLAGRAQALVFIDVGADTPAAIICDADYGVGVRTPYEQ